MFQTGGKPSTWFPPVGLVELYFPSNALFISNSITKILINFNGWLMITMMIMMMMTTMTMTMMIMTTGVTMMAMTMTDTTTGVMDMADELISATESSRTP